MELKLDTSKIYAVALEGGGARGAWQVGAWRALEEAGVRYNAVSGTSVGAINGALMAMRDLKQAEQIWKDIRFSQIIGKPVQDAMALTNKAVVEALDGLPAHKVHCSVLAEEAIKNALKDYFDKNGIPYDAEQFKETDHEALHNHVHGE